MARRLAEVRQKVDEATRNATEDKRLGNRTAGAIESLFKYKDMAQLIKALTDLGISCFFKLLIYPKSESKKMTSLHVHREGIPLSPRAS
jgi:hypothetical protein